MENSFLRSTKSSHLLIHPQMSTGNGQGCARAQLESRKLHPGLTGRQQEVSYLSQYVCL